MSQAESNVNITRTVDETETAMARAVGIVTCVYYGFEGEPGRSTPEAPEVREALLAVIDSLDTVRSGLKTLADAARDKKPLPRPSNPGAQQMN